MKTKKLVDKIKEYHFEFKHVTVLFIILFAFQLIVSFINKAAIKSFLNNTQDWYQKESAEEIARLRNPYAALFGQGYMEPSGKLTPSGQSIFDQYYPKS